MSDVVDYFFPPLERTQSANVYNSVSFWREPLPAIDPEFELVDETKPIKGDNPKVKIKDVKR